MYQRTADHNAVLAREKFSVHWDYDATSKINSGLAVVGDLVLFDTFGKTVVALNARTGSPVWRANADNIIMSTPVVLDGRVYVGTGDNGGMGLGKPSFVYATTKKTYQGDMWGRAEGDHIITFDVASGERRWAYRTMGEDMPSPALVDGMVVFANGDAHAYGLSAASGDARWRTDLDGITTMASATLTGHDVLFSTCEFASNRKSTYALSPKTGAVRWRAPYGDCDSSPTYANGRVFVSGVDGARTSFGYGGRTIIAALDAQRGNALWVYRSPTVGAYTKIGSSERAIAGAYADGMYFQSLVTSDELIAFDAATGAIRWRVHSMGPIKMSPVIKAGRVYVGDTVGVFYTIDEHTGRLLATRLFEQQFSTSPPVIVGDTVFVVAGSIVHAFTL